VSQSPGPLADQKPAERPADDAPHAAWLEYAIARGHDPAAAAGRTRDQLRLDVGAARFGAEPELERHLPEPPRPDAGHADWIAYAVRRGWPPFRARLLTRDALRAALMAPQSEAEQAAEAAAAAEFADSLAPPLPPAQPRGPWSEYMTARGLTEPPGWRARTIEVSRVAVTGAGDVAEVALNANRDALARWCPAGGSWGPWWPLSDRSAVDVSVTAAGTGVLCSAVLAVPQPLGVSSAEDITQVTAYFRLSPDGPRRDPGL
jgi:hypothetical protein